MIYLDASALVTLVVGRRHAGELREFLSTHGAAKTCTATMGFVETVRACRRAGDFPQLMRRLLREHTEIPLSAEVRDAAANVRGTLRTVDAIHVASAGLLGPALIALVTYDDRMADAARDAGLPVATPGLE